LKNDYRNQYQIANSHSKYRYDKMEQLFNETPKITPKIAASILRNKEGLNNEAIGYGNEKALNQLIAHHGIIFKPEQLLVWVSSNPYQLGEFVCYDLNKIFKNRNANDAVVSVEEEQLNIPKDDFVDSQAYKNYEIFRIKDRILDAYLENKTVLPSDFVKNYQSLNPDYWIVYYKVGISLYQHKKYQLAKEQFEIALNKEITTVPSKLDIEKYLKKIKRKLQ
jgi:tetratricopeptide (TPR) repeat protein